MKPNALASPFTPAGSTAASRSAAPAPATRRLHRWCPAFALALGAAACGGAGAAPIAPDAQRQLGVYAPGTECAQTSDGAWIPCATTTDATLGLAVTGYWGAQVIASAAVGMDSMAAHLQGITRHGWDVGMPVMDLVQFDQITVTGPTATVQIGVHAHIVGTGAPSNGDYAYGTWTFAIGARNPAPAADYNHYGDWLAVGGRVLQDSQQMWSASIGAVHPAVDEMLAATLNVSTGQAFELGSELTISVLNLDVSFSQVQWSFDVPDGYALTSTRGLSVGAVPEPGGTAMMLAGLAALGFLAARRHGDTAPKRGAGPA